MNCLSGIAFEDVIIPSDYDEDSGILTLSKTIFEGEVFNATQGADLIAEGISFCSRKVAPTTLGTCEAELSFSEWNAVQQLANIDMALKNLETSLTATGTKTAEEMVFSDNVAALMAEGVDRTQAIRQVKAEFLRLLLDIEYCGCTPEEAQVVTDNMKPAGVEKSLWQSVQTECNAGKTALLPVVIEHYVGELATDLVNQDLTLALNAQVPETKNAFYGKITYCMSQCAQ